MPGSKPNLPNSCVLQDYDESRLPEKRRASRLFQKPKSDADAWCQLLEGIEEVGLLPQVLQHLEGRDLFALASSTRFFRHQAIGEMSRRVTRLLKHFINNTRALAYIMNAMDVRISGAALYPLIFKSQAKVVNHALYLNVKHARAAKALGHHLKTVEGYEITVQPAPHNVLQEFQCPEVSGKLNRSGMIVSEETWEHPIRETKIFIKILVSESSNLNWVIQQGHNHTLSVLQITANSFTIFYPELTFRKQMRYLQTLVDPSMYKGAWEDAQQNYGFELLKDGPNNGKVLPYFSWRNTQKPLSMPLRLM